MHLPIKHIYNTNAELNDVFLANSIIIIFSVFLLCNLSALLLHLFSVVRFGCNFYFSVSFFPIFCPSLSAAYTFDCRIQSIPSVWWQICNIARLIKSWDACNINGSDFSLHIFSFSFRSLAACVCCWERCAKLNRMTMMVDEKERNSNDMCTHIDINYWFYR